MKNSEQRESPVHCRDDVAKLELLLPLHICSMMSHHWWPPPRQSTTGWFFCWRKHFDLSKFVKSPFWQYKRAFSPSLTQANANLNFNFHCISTPNHPGNCFDPPPQQKSKQMPIWTSLNKCPKASNGLQTLREGPETLTGWQRKNLKLLLTDGSRIELDLKSEIFWDFTMLPKIWYFLDFFSPNLKFFRQSEFFPKI